MKSNIQRINAHGHLLPYPAEIPSFMKEKKIFWVTEDKSCMCQGDWVRPVTDPSFFLQEKLEWMEHNHIDKEVVLNLSQLYCNGMPQALARDVIRFQNDFNAGIASGYPDKFISGFVVQPLYLEDALKEAERCVSMGLRLMCLPTHYVNHESKWVETANESVLPLFEFADQNRLAIEFHPYNAEKFIHLEDHYWRFHLIWLCAQTADLYHFFSCRDFAHRFPAARFCFAHGNQFGQMGYGRRRQGFLGRPDLFENAVDPIENIHAGNVYFDTLVHDVLSFELLVKRQGVRQIVAGLDDPYPLGEMESVKGSFPGKVIDEALECGIIHENDYADIWYGNVMEWLGL